MSLRGDTKLSGAVIGAAIAVHRELGPGQDEPNYESALAVQLGVLGVAHEPQRALPLRYKGVRLDCGYRIDLLVENRLVVECKSVESIHPIHEAQLLTYLRLSGREVGLLINFDVPVLKDGVRRRLWSHGRNDVRDGTENLTTASAFSPGPDDSLSSEVIAAAIEVHRELGPGLLRSAYEECLCYELSQHRIRFRRKHPLQVCFKGAPLPSPVEVPLLVEHEMPVMCLSVDQLTNLHTARLLALLRQGNWQRGLILNFNALSLVEGLRRVVHNPDSQGGPAE